MSRPSYQRIKQILGEASELSGDARRAYLDQACGDDDALRAEVEQLLRHGDDEANPLETDVVPVSSEQLAELAENTATSFGDMQPALPERIGPFRIVRRLATGGMGTVHEAEQDNPSRRVALKVLRRELLSPTLLRRFQQESQILGRLQHAGIAQIHEAGTLEAAEGPLPYFAMEFVDGRPLTAYADDQHLDQRARLQLFARICDAVQHAHERGVIHRDLKPDNVLVTADGQPKVLDFGVARATDADMAAITVVTEVGQIMGTLPYMSPEQVSGDPDAIDARSDVYSLGVMLYELLCGQRPHELGRLTVPSAARIIREETATRLGSLDTRLRGDVETIVGTALDKDIRRRYATAAELAADIRRHLGAQPISAHAPSRAYQLKKFAVRHRGLMVGLALAFVALAVGFGVAVRFAVDEAAQRRAAERASYRNAMTAATSLHLDSVESQQVARILEEIPEEQRGWEWRHLHSRLARQLWETEALHRPHTGGSSMYSAYGVPVLFSDDGARVISQVDEQTVGVWDTATGERLHTIDVGQPILPGGLVPGPDGLVALVDQQLILCDDEAGIITHVEPLPWRPLTVRWDRHGDRYAVTCMGADAGEDGYDDFGRLLLGPLGALTPVAFEPRKRHRTLAWAHEGRTLLLYHDGFDGDRQRDAAGIDFLDTVTRQLRGPLSTAGRAQFAVSTQVGSDLMITMRNPRGVDVLHIGEAGLELRQTLIGHREPLIRSMALSHDASVLASATHDGSVHIWDRLSGELLEAHDIEGHPNVAVSPSGSHVAVHAAGRLRVWRPGTTAVQVLPGPGSFVYELSWSPDGRRLVARDFHTNQLVYDAVEGRALVPVVRVPRQEPWWNNYDWALSADGRFAVTSAEGRGVTTRDLVSGRETDTPVSVDGESVREATRRAFLEVTGRAGAAVDHTASPRADRGELSAMAYLLDPAGQLALDIKALQLQDARTGAVLHQLSHAEAWSHWNQRNVGASFSPDGRRVAVAHIGAEVLVFSTSTGELLAELEGHTSTVYRVAWSPDGQRIASGSNDRTIRIWDAATYDSLAVLRGHEGYVMGLAWNPDGQTLASGSEDGTVRLWSTLTVEQRGQAARSGRAERERQRPWVTALFEQHDDPQAVANAVRAAENLDADQRHAALCEATTLAAAWWAERDGQPAGDDDR